MLTNFPARCKNPSQISTGVYRMFKFLRRRSSQISSHPILERGIDAMVIQRNTHLAEMNRLETVIAEATRAYDQHTRLYDALNNSLFAINHPFTDADAADMGNAMEAVIAADFDLSVDQLAADDRAEAAYAAEVNGAHGLPLAPTPAEVAVRNAEEAAAMAGMRNAAEALGVIPLRSSKRRKATAAEAAE